MKNISTGAGLALLAAAILAFSVVSQLYTTERMAQAGASKTSAVSGAAMGHTEPTIVWYGTSVGNDGLGTQAFWRAWSDGRVEVRRIALYSGGGWCGEDIGCHSPWFVVSSADEGYASASDINFDEQVDGADLGTLLAMWGRAPRRDIPPSDCPLNLVNP